MNHQFPEKLAPLFQPMRYKVLKGGRGGAKSWGIARALLLMGTTKPLRIVCAREFMKSISQSVHALLSDQISAMGFASFYEILNNEIRGKNGTQFLFAGLHHNVQNIKSLEGCHICWVEEAQSVSPSSWNTLIPTIRKDNSEIWISFNPELETDPTYERFVTKPPKNSVLITINHSDNPWFPSVLRDEMEDLRTRNYDQYLNVWEGHCKVVLDGAIFANEIRAATLAERFTSVPLEPSKPVQTFWDLGRADKTAIWFAQQVGFEFRVIDYYENQGYALGHYLKVLQDRGYTYGDCWLPHDADNELLASERTITQQVRAFGYKTRSVPKTSIASGIEAARSIFPNVFFDKTKCADGLHCLRHYKYDVDPDTRQYSKVPLHDWASHGADAFRYLAVAMRAPKEAHKPLQKQPIHVPGGDSWMG